MQTLVFSDTNEFYEELKHSLDSGQKVEVVTDYTHFSDLPKKLKDIFELHQHRTNEWVSITTNAFVVGSRAKVGFNRQPLYVLGSAGIGAIAGLFIGGPVGAAVGAGIGTLIGIGAAAMESGKHEVNVEVDTAGRLRVIVTPKQMT